MLEHLLGLLMVGIGLQPPNLQQGSVMGDETSVVQTVQPAESPLREGTQVNTLNNKQLAPATQKEEAKEETTLVAKDKQGMLPAGRVSDNKQQVKRGVSQQTDNNLLVSTQEAKLLPRASVSAFNERKAAFQQEILVKREEAKERFALAREEFKQKLSAVTDQKKQAILTTIDQRLSTINTNRTDALSKRLDRLDNIATNLSDRLTTAELEGANVTQTKTLLATAQTSIAAARTAVAQQAGQEYVINITTEDALRDQAQQAKTTLETDLKAIDVKVKEAHDALLKAIQSLASSLKQAGVQEGGQ